MDFDDLNKSTENNQMEHVIDDLTFDLFKKGCENLTADSFVGKAIFITEPKTEHSNSFAGFEFIEDPTAFKHIVKYQ